MKTKVLLSILSVASIGLLVYSLRDDQIEKNGANISEKNEKISNSRVTQHFNMVIVPDLSNRVTKPKPVDDLDIIESILNDISSIYLKSQNRRIGQKDQFQVLLTNQSLINSLDAKMDNLRIDFSKFQRQRNRIEYITGVNRTYNLKSDIVRFKNELKEAYSNAKNNVKGADVISFFKSLDKATIKPKGEIKNLRTEDGRVIYQEYRNVLILLTDGYIEADMYSKTYNEDNIYPNLSEKRINSFRKDYLKNGKGRTMKQFFKDLGYGITPVDNPLLSEVEILVLELDDRSKNANGNASSEISDDDIIKLFWTDWLTKSGVKKFELHSTANSISDIKYHIKNFLN